MPVPYIAQSDNTSVAPVKVMPVFDPKYKTTFAFTDQQGRRMFVTPSKAKNATIKEDKRSKQEKEISQKRAQIDAQNQKEERKQQEAMQKLAGFGKFISPSTYVGPLLKDNGKSYLSNVAAGKGFGNGFINFAFDISSPFLFKGFGNVIGEETKYLFPRTKLYSDNALVNAYATLARRYNLPDKARLPYLIRRVKNDALDFTDDGNAILNGGRFRHTNFSYDRIVAPHSSGSWDKAQQTLLINPREFVKNNKFGSIEPSDMFTLQDPAEGLVVPPSDIINITANPTSTRLSTQHGIQTFSSTPLRQQELAALKADHQEYLDNFGKRFELARNSRNGVNRDYWYAVFDIQKKFGRPKVKDIRLLEQTTGLKSGISSTADIPRFRAIKQSDLNNVLPDEMEDYVNNLPVFNNGRRFNWRKWNDYEGVQYPYKNFFYDPATHAEDNFTFPTY